jgi:PPOX class probable F420-dependent enzyme
MEVPPQAQQKLEQQKIIWVASVRADGRPHLVPVWFAWRGERIYLCIDPASVKANNLATNPHIALALENGLHPVICEGQATICEPPWPEAVLAVFQQKYDWNISTETQYTQLLEVNPDRWLVW